jgi:hypothetical protein
MWAVIMPLLTFTIAPTQTSTDQDLLRNFLTLQTNHGQFDWFGGRPVQLKAQVVFPHLPAKIAVPSAEAETTFRTLLPRSPSNGAVWAFKSLP